MIVLNPSDKKAMETALLQTQRPDRTRPDFVGNGGSAGTTNDLRTVEKRGADKQPLSRNRQTLWRKRAFEGARVHEGNKAK